VDFLMLYVKKKPNRGVVGVGAAHKTFICCYC